MELMRQQLHPCRPGGPEHGARSLVGDEIAADTPPPPCANGRDWRAHVDGDDILEGGEDTLNAAGIRRLDPQQGEALAPVVRANAGHLPALPSHAHLSPNERALA